MKPSRYGDYVNGGFAKTGDTSSIHCSFFSRVNAFEIEFETVKCIKMQTLRPQSNDPWKTGKQHKNRYNCN